MAALKDHRAPLIYAALYLITFVTLISITNCNAPPAVTVTATPQPSPVPEVEVTPAADMDWLKYSERCSGWSGRCFVRSVDVELEIACYAYSDSGGGAIWCHPLGPHEGVGR